MRGLKVLQQKYHGLYDQLIALIHQQLSHFIHNIVSSLLIN
jgi:hypothetical protein